MASGSIFKVTVLVVILAEPKMCDGLILRLHCKEVADFSVVKSGSVLDGALISAFPSVDAEQCKALCVENNQCSSINIESSGSQVCQLNNKTIVDTRFGYAGLLRNKTGWSFITTNFNDALVGENCKAFNPCPKGELCTDTCECSGYQCNQCSQNQTGLHCYAWKDCKDIRKSGYATNGTYQVKASPFQNLPVYCEFTHGDSWIVIQRRVDDSTDFNRDWSDYKNGFGDPNGNFWIGLDKINLLAGPGRGAELRIDMKHNDSPSRVYFAQYSKFEVGNETEEYVLSVGDYYGDAGDSLVNCKGNYVYGCAVGMKFSTKDKDNDVDLDNCAAKYHSGWWHKRCFNGNLNSLFSGSQKDPDVVAAHMSWSSLHGSFGGIIYSQMKIRYN